MGNKDLECFWRKVRVIVLYKQAGIYLHFYLLSFLRQSRLWSTTTTFLPKWDIKNNVTIIIIIIFAIRILILLLLLFCYPAATIMMINVYLIMSRFHTHVTYLFPITKGQRK